MLNSRESFLLIWV